MTIFNTSILLKKIQPRLIMTVVANTLALVLIARVFTVFYPSLKRFFNIVQKLKQTWPEINYQNRLTNEIRTAVRKRTNETNVRLSRDHNHLYPVPTPIRIKNMIVNIHKIRFLVDPRKICIPILWVCS